MSTAQQILDRYWDGKLPIDVKSLAKAMGATIVAKPMAEESGSVEMQGGTPVIHFSSTESVVRQRFTIAHEIGHIALGHLDGAKKKFRDPAAHFSTGTSDPEEREANRFAAQLLMPRRIVEYALNEKNIRTVEGLASAFAVSQVAMKWRLVNLGLIRG